MTLDGYHRTNIEPVPASVGRTWCIVCHVQILVKSSWIASFAFESIHAPEAVCARAQVSGAVVVQGKGRVVLLASKQVIVWRGACGVDEVAEGVVVVGIGDSSSRIRKLTYAAVAVVPIEAWRPGAADLLVFIDTLQTLGVGAGDCTTLQFVHNLRIAGWIRVPRSCSKSMLTPVWRSAWKPRPR